MIRYYILFLIIFCKAEAQTSALQLADSLYVYGEYSKAIEAYKNYEDSSVVLLKIAKAYVAIGNYDEGLAYYEKTILSTPKNQLYKYQYAKLLFRVKQIDKAKRVFEELIKLNAKNPNYHYELGNVKRTLGDTSFIKSYETTYKLDPQHIKAINKIGRYALAKRDYTKALKMANRGLEIYAKSKEFTSLKAQTYYWQENYFNAKEWFIKRLELGEPTQFIYEKLSYCYERNYEHKKTIEYLEKALKLDPKNAQNLYLIGKQYAYLEDFKKAEMYLSKALEFMDAPLDREYMALGSALNRQKKYKEAIVAYKNALRHNPKSEFVPFFLTHTKAQYYKDFDVRIKLYEDFIKKYPKSKLKSMAEYERDKLKKEQFMKGN